MAKAIHINILRHHLERAKDRLAVEKADILDLYSSPHEFNREEYIFNYVRSERIGLRAINTRLSEVSWLPMQLDPHSEILGEGRNPMRKWLTKTAITLPSSNDFGNDFIHTLARCAANYSMDDETYINLTMRVANLFRDLSCLIGLIYYCTWLGEHGIENLPITNPNNLRLTAEQIAAMLQSPEFFEKLQAKTPPEPRKLEPKNSNIPNQHHRNSSKNPSKKQPKLQLIITGREPEPNHI